MKQAFLYFIIFSLISCKQKARVTVSKEIVFEEYFPIKKNTTKFYYVSHLTGNDTLIDKNDSSICKSDTIRGKEIFYFTDEPDDSVSIISSQSFCDGIFYFENGEFFVSPIFWKADIKKSNLDYFERLFPKTIALDSIYKQQDCNQKKKFSFSKLEDLFIKGRTMSDCLKLTIVQDWPTEQYTDTVWFKKNIGVVKWFRSTGRLEEIKM